jgi:replication factor C subunit 3/5
LIVLDEADALTQTAQNALRRVVEQYTKNVRFCMICNYVGKIIPALQSRCTRFRFAPLELSQIDDRLKVVIENEGYLQVIRVKISEDGKKALLELSEGDMRRALNILQSAHSSYDFIHQDTIYQTTGAPLPSDIEKIVDWLFNSEFSEAYTNIRAIQIEKGIALNDIITRVFQAISNLELPKASRTFLIQQMADIEHNLSVGTMDKIQLSAFVGAFKVAMDMTESQSLNR